jgi:type IV pilus assembly protein PilB
MISNHTDTDEMLAYAKEHQHMRTLRESATQMVLDGISTPEELMKITYE